MALLDASGKEPRVTITSKPWIPNTVGIYKPRCSILTASQPLL